MRMNLVGCGVALSLSVLAAEPAPRPPAPELDPLVLARIRDAAMASDWAFEKLTALTDEVGPRLAGSAGAAAAVAQISAELADAGFAVRLQPVKVTHWVRGEERGELSSYPGRPAGLSQAIHLTALGGSGATPAQGLVAPVLVLHSFEELSARAAELKGKIALFSVAFDQRLANAGEAGQAYGQGSRVRTRGPSRLAEAGAVAALVRSVGGADYRLPHTGFTRGPEDGGVPLPAAAVTSEDAQLIERLAAKGPVTMKLTLTPRTLPKADSANVIAELPGREKPEELVVVSGHLDSWDLGTGALDDGAGVISAMAAVRLLKSLDLHPRRTIRAIAWMDEENGGTGGKAYFEALKNDVGAHVAVVEADSGAGRPLGLLVNLPREALKRLEAVSAALAPLGAPVLKRVDNPLGADISSLQEAGVPGFEPLLDGHSYFDYHHTAADTLDKVDPDNLRRQVAVLAVLIYALAEMPEPLPRLPVKAP